MRVTLSQLEALFWVARLGSVSNAARHLNVTQPTISLRLRDLAAACGKPLHRRDGRALALTSDGLEILDHAARIIDEVAQIHQRDQPSEARGLLKLGVSEAFALAGLPRMLPKLAARHPSLRLELAIGTSGDLERDLLDGAIDLAIAISPDFDDRLRIIPLGIQEAAWIAPATMNLPTVVRPIDIAHLPILTNPAPSPAYQTTVNWFGSAGLEPRQISVTNSVMVIAHMVEAGIGLAILPFRLVLDRIELGKLVALRSYPNLEPALMSIAYRKSDRRPSIDAVIEGTREALDELDWLEPGQAGSRRPTL